MNSKKYRKQTKEPIGTNEQGKLPPQALELEQDVLGAIMLEKGAFDLISDFMKPEMFYDPCHQKIFDAIVKLDLLSQPIDMRTVTEMLRKQGTLEEIGGPYKIALLTSSVSSTAHLVFHAQIIMQKYLSREMIRIASEIQNKAYEEADDVEDIMNEFERRFTELSTGIIPVDNSDMIDCIMETKDILITIQKERSKGGKMFVKTPLVELNNSLKGGFRGGQLIIIAGRPGMGKTQIAINIAEKASETANGLFFSMEMQKDEIIQRMILKNELIDDYRMETGQMSMEEWSLIDKEFGKLSKLNLSIIDNQNSFSKIRSTIRRKKRENKCDFAIIDYIGLVQTNTYFQTRDLEIGFMTNNLKALAMELNIPIIALSQLSRPAKGMSPKRPQLTDLRESGNIEQDADIVIFVHRPTYYDKNAIDEDGNSYSNRGLLVKAKHRNGIVEDIQFSHDNRFKKIWDYEPNNQKELDKRFVEMNQNRWNDEQPF